MNFAKHPLINEEGGNMTDPICSLLANDNHDYDYDWSIDDFDGVDYIGDALEEGVSLDDFFRSFSFHRVNGDSYEYGGNACD
jgi:hypothetical protein